MDVDLETLMGLADAADAETLPRWRSASLTHETKDDGSPVTAGDRAAEAALLEEIGRHFPGAGFLGEETGEVGGSAGRRWIVDGIDGTGSFIAGREEWSTLIALVVDSVPVAGIVSAPALGARWWAAGGVANRTTASGESTELRVSGVGALDGDRLASWPPVSHVRSLALQEPAERLEDFTGAHSGIRPSQGAGVPNGAMLVAEGRYDAFVLFGGGPWDHAAPAAIVAAAGGRFSDLDGSTALTSGVGVYSNGHVHDELLDRLAG